MPEIQRKGKESVMVEENKQKNMFGGDFLLPRSPTGQNREKGQHRDFDVCFNCQHLWHIFMFLSLLSFQVLQCYSHFLFVFQWLPGGCTMTLENIYFFFQSFF